MRRTINIFGAAASFFVMAWILWRFGGAIPRIDFTDRTVWLSFTIAVVLYIGVLIMAARAWRILITGLGAHSKPSAAESQLLIAQIGKYLPGNFAHFAGRAALAIQDGASPAAVGLALFAETALTVAAGLGVAIVGLWSLPGVAEALGSTMPAQSDLAMTAVAAVVVMGGVLGGAMLLKRRGLLDPWARLDARNVLLVLLIQMVAFGLLGASLYLIAGIAAPSGTAPLSLTIVVFAAAWVAGLVTPGAPGGLGVRETIITLGLGAVIGGPAALATALLHRGVSVGGDVIAFGIGWVLRNR